MRKQLMRKMSKRGLTVDEMITAPEAAILKGVTNEAVYAAIATGRLSGFKKGGRFLIPRAALEDWRIVGHRPRKDQGQGATVETD